MGSKLILLLGLLVGAFLTLMCVNENKNALSLKYNQLLQNDAVIESITPAATVVEPEPQAIPEPAAPVVKKLDEPTFSYSLKDKTKLSAKLSEKDKNEELEKFILAYCPTDTCTQDLTFYDDIKDASWQTDVLQIAAFLKDKNVKNGAISVNDKLLNLEGELKNSEEMDALNKLLKSFSPEIFKMKNITTVAPKLKVKEVKIADTATSPSIKQTQNEISKLLKENPILFEFNSSNITQKSKNILDQIIDILKGYDSIELTVEGHTDSGGSDTYNKMLSQKRAEAVKNYLKTHDKNDRKIKAIGYGEEKPISSNPREKINRRVEIHLKRGE